MCLPSWTACAPTTTRASKIIAMTMAITFSKTQNNNTGNTLPEGATVQDVHSRFSASLPAYAIWSLFSPVSGSNSPLLAVVPPVCMCVKERGSTQHTHQLLAFQTRHHHHHRIHDNHHQCWTCISFCRFSSRAISRGVLPLPISDAWAHSQAAAGQTLVIR